MYIKNQLRVNLVFTIIGFQSWLTRGVRRQMSPVIQTVTEPVWLGEGPHWDHAEQALYFVSIFDHTVNKYVPDTGKHTKAKLGKWTEL